MTRLVLDSLDSAQQNFAVLDLIPDTHTWVKDRQGLFVFGNRLFYQRFGIDSLAQLTGKTDFDLAPADMARRYRADDDHVLGGGVVTDRLELIGGGESVEWFLTSKWPVYNRREAIIGTAGISRHLNRSEQHSVPYRDLSAPINYIRQHFSGPISVAELAAACNLSVSALERRFSKHLGKTPRQYITDVRLGQAQRLLLETDKPIGTIALETGFADHSHFTRAFRRHFDRSPSDVRLHRLVA